MFRHVIVAGDGGQSGRDAIALAEQLVDPDGSVTLAHGYGRGLCALAEDEDADLLVVGSSHHEILGRELAAGDTHEALAVASCAVAIAPRRYAQHRAQIRTIGVRYDDSPQSDNAVRIAQDLARRYAAKLSAFEAVSLPSYTFIGGAVPLEDEQLDEIVDAARERIAALGGVEAGP